MRLTLRHFVLFLWALYACCGLTKAQQLPPPNNVQASVNLPSQIDLVWTKGKNVTSYDIYRIEGEGEPSKWHKIADKHTNNRYIDKDPSLKPNVYYSYFLKSVDEHGSKSGFSKAAKGKLGIVAGERR